MSWMRIFAPLLSPIIDRATNTIKRSALSRLGGIVVGTLSSAAVRFGLPAILNASNATFPQTGILTTTVVGGITGFVTGTSSQAFIALTRANPRAWSRGSIAKALSIMTAATVAGTGIALAITSIECAIATGGYHIDGMPANVTNMTTGECLNNVNVVNTNAIAIITWGFETVAGIAAPWVVSNIADRFCNRPRSGYRMLP